MEKIKVFLADDHTILRESLVILLSRKEDIEVVGECGDGHEAFRRISELRPDVAVLDISMPELNGLELAAKLRGDLPDVKIVILTMHKTEEYVAKALVAGVHGYVLKDNALEELIACIEAVYSGKVFLSKDVTGFVVDGFVDRLKDASAYQGDAVSAREREVLQLLAEGKSNKDISAELNLSVKTVETHRANIMRKLSLKNIADLVLYAVRNHIIEP